LVHSSFNNTTLADFHPPDQSALAQSMGGRLVFTHGCYLISNLECEINLFCAGRASEYLCRFWSEAIGSILSLLPAPNGNVNDVLQIKHPPCKQWPYLYVFHGRLCSQGHVVLIQLTRRPNREAVISPKTNDNVLIVKHFICQSKAVGM